MREMWLTGDGKNRGAGGVRVELREFSLRYAEKMARLLNDYKVWVNLSDNVPFPYTKADALGFIAEVMSRRSGYVCYIVEADGRMAGIVGYERLACNKRYTGQVGYWYGEKFWGRGIATEALRQLVDRVFSQSDIVRLEGTAFDYNEASQRVMLKCGFQKEAVLRHSLVKEGKFYDEVILSLLKEDYLKTRKTEPFSTVR